MSICKAHCLSKRFVPKTLSKDVTRNISVPLQWPYSWGVIKCLKGQFENIFVAVRVIGPLLKKGIFFFYKRAPNLEIRGIPPFPPASFTNIPEEANSSEGNFQLVVITTARLNLFANLAVADKVAEQSFRCSTRHSDVCSW